mgnify:CR=1 FL=1
MTRLPASCLRAISQQLGFREIEFTRTEVDENYNRITTEYEPITINGQPLLFRGTNRHDTDPFGGKYVPKEVYEEDVKLMKEWNPQRDPHFSLFERRIPLLPLRQVWPVYDGRDKCGMSRDHGPERQH